MDSKYSKHFLMDTNTVVQYIKDTVSFFEKDADLEACEIGDGNINYVFKVYDKKSGKSLVVKQADKLLRSSGRPLDLHRNKIEAEILGIEGTLVPGYTPKIYDYNEQMYALTMEDISEYKNLRKELMLGKIFPKLAEDITTFMVNTLMPTSDLVLDRHEKKKKVQLFTNIDLCDITEDLVLTEPYYNYKNRNIITKGEEEFVETNLYNNEPLKAEVGYLRNHFMNYAQALIHGDLHSGSIFINESGLKVIDPEFAFYGPMGYDTGNVIGNLFFPFANKMVNKTNEMKFIHWIEKSIGDIFDLLKLKLDKKFDECVELPLYNTEFKHRYIASVMADTMGYAGTEMIRRTVGDSKVAEITSVTEPGKRMKLDKIVVLTGIQFIENRNVYKNGEEIVNEFKKVMNSI